MRTLAIVASISLAVIRLAAQNAEPPAFDAVSIKENEPNDRGGSIFMLQNGRWRATNVPVLAVISTAWNVPQNRIYGAPDWAAATRYEFNAVTQGTATREQEASMVQAMLRDRFKLAVHKEQRELPIYNLVVARADGRLGPSLRAPSQDCLGGAAAAAAKPGSRPCRMDFGTGSAAGTTTIDNLAIVLTSASGRPVFNRTSLAGFYEFALTWTPGVTTEPGSNAASIFTAVQEQLGLKLESATAALDVVIVDHVEKPTPN